MAISLRGTISKARAVLPEGRALPIDVWQSRHRGVLKLLWLHAGGLALFSLARGHSVFHALAETVILAAAALLAGSGRLRTTERSAVAAVGLITASAVFVHLSGGVVEVHFHFFVMIGVLTLYQQWTPFLVAVGYVVLHHGLLGSLMPEVVYNHQAAISQPWKWALIHGAFVLAASGANLLAWRMNEHQSLHDSLTGLPNRILLADRIEQALARRDGRAQTALLYLDLDGFKAVNDSLGHAAGDDLLIAAARRLRDCVRPGDTTCRLGGDEFALLVTELRVPVDAFDVAQRTIDSLAEPFMLRDTAVSVTVSVGVAFPGDGVDGNELLRNADVAMYKAKRTGGGFEVFQPMMHAEIVERLTLEAELHQAVARQQLVMHYQPLVQLDSRGVVGVEALVRWARPGFGLVPPLDFIRIAEESGAIIPIGSWVLHEACRQAAAWRDGPAPDLQVSVNLSPRQLLDAGVVDVVSSALAASGLEPTALTLEITEGDLVSDTAAVISRLEDLRALGVRVAIDDFGTGYSSLSYLRRLPVDVLKIDKYFVQKLDRGPEESALVSAVLHVARALGLSVVAEGVETADQLDELRSLGCTQAQGFYLGRPASADAIGDVLRSAPGALPAMAALFDA
jgi:diguanylate cyclase (GGDEF)-like protein